MDKPTDARRPEYRAVIAGHGAFVPEKTLTNDDLADMINFRIEATILPSGAFANYTAQRQAEGADLAHLKPPHINPSDKVLTLLRAKPQAIPETVMASPDTQPVTV